MSDFEERQRKEREAIDLAVTQTVEACDGKARMDEVLARVLCKHTCPSLYLEWTFEKFWALQTPKLLKDLNKIYKELKKRKATTRDHDVCFNDLDDHVWIIPHKKYNVMVHTGQSFRFLYIWDKKQVEGFRELHIRRFYDKWEAPDSKDDLSKLDQKYVDIFAKQTKEKGYVPAIIKAQRFTEEYADDYEGVPYPRRYSLDTFVKQEFEMEYGDGRDIGYICSWREFHDKVDWAWMHHSEIKLIHECFVPSILCELFEGDDQIASTTGGEEGFDSHPA